MKNYFFILIVFMFFQTEAQSDSIKSHQFEHSISFSHYTFFPFYNGGSEIDYTLRYYTKSKVEFTARTGLFFMSPVGSNIVDSRPITARSTTYIPFYLGTGFYFGRNRQANVHLDIGIPIYWPTDYSKIVNSDITGAYWFTWTNFSEKDAAFYRQRILLIPQLQFSYFFKGGIGFQLGFSSYLTKVRGGSTEFLSVNVSGKLGLSYRF